MPSTRRSSAFRIREYCGNVKSRGISGGFLRGRFSGNALTFYTERYIINPEGIAWKNERKS
jgi:hypothetical protein